MVMTESDQERPRAGWASPEDLERGKREPDFLARLVSAALDRGFSKELLSASDYLFRTDPDPVRRYTLRARVLARSHRFRDADVVLDRLVELYGHSAHLHAARAFVARARNLPGKTSDALWDALTLDPNHEEALVTWIDEHRKQGSAALATALEKVAALDGSWRAKCAILRERLERHEGDDIAPLVGAAFTDASGPIAMHELANLLADHEQFELLARHLEPRYSPTLDGVGAGVALMLALYRLERAVEGLELLRRIEPHAGGFEDHIRMFADAFGATPAAEPDEALMQALASVARHDTEKNRVVYYRAIARAEFLVPMRHVLVPLREEADDGIVAFEAVSSTADDVLLAFTDRERLAAWDGSRPLSLRHSAKELLHRARKGGRGVVLNAAGPAAMTITPREIEAMLDGRIPATPEAHEDGGIVIERLRRPLPQAMIDGVLDRLVNIDLQSAHLVRLVDEKRGVNLGVALTLASEKRYREIESILGELNDRTSGIAELRRVRFFIPPEGLRQRIAEIGTRAEVRRERSLKLDLR
jgi:hypothetical protein